MNWLLFALGAVLINTSLGLGLRKLTVGSVEPRMLGLTYNIYAAGASIIIWIVSGAPFPHGIALPIVALTLLSALGYGIFQRGQFFLRKQVEVSRLTPIFQTGAIAGFLVALFVLNKNPTLLNFLGVLLIASGCLLVTNFKNVRFDRYAIMAILIASALSIATVIDKLASPHFPLTFYAMLIWLLPLPLIAYPASVEKVMTSAKSAGPWLLVLAGINALSLVLSVRAFQLGEASKVIPVLSTTTILTVLGGILILGERSDWRRKVLAGTLAAIGIYLLH